MNRILLVMGVMGFLTVSTWADDPQWSALGNGCNNIVRAMVLYDVDGDSDLDLVVGGDFTSPGNYLAYWNGSSWHAFDDEPNGAVFALAVYMDEVQAIEYLVVGGRFTCVGEAVAGHIAGFDGGIGLSLAVECPAVA